MPKPDACAATPFGRSVRRKHRFVYRFVSCFVSWRKANMTAATSALSHRLRPILAAISIGAAAALVSQPAFARGPEGIADVAEKVIDAVVNISTSQTIEAKSDGHSTIPQLPPGSPFEEFFDDFFKNRRGGPGGPKGGDLQPHKTNSLGSGFIVDT